VRSSDWSPSRTLGSGRDEMHPRGPELGDDFHAKKAVWEVLKSSLRMTDFLAHSVHVRDDRMNTRSTCWSSGPT
jgi:hypothetical protein